MLYNHFMVLTVNTILNQNNASEIIHIYFINNGAVV